MKNTVLKCMSATLFAGAMFTTGAMSAVTHTPISAQAVEYFDYGVAYTSSKYKKQVKNAKKLNHASYGDGAYYYSRDSASFGSRVSYRIHNGYIYSGISTATSLRVKNQNLKTFGVKNIKIKNGLLLYKGKKITGLIKIKSYHTTGSDKFYVDKGRIALYKP